MSDKRKYKSMFSVKDYERFIKLQRSTGSGAMKEFAESWLSSIYAFPDPEHQEKMYSAATMLLEEAKIKRLTEDTEIIMSLFMTFVISPFLEQHSSQHEIRRRLKQALRLAHKKNRARFPLIKYLPYTVEQLMEHLENQFQEGMTWKNYGGHRHCWNMDHIHPRSRLLYDSVEHPNFRKCWALNNLRPMWVKDNVAKGASILDK